MRLRTDYLSGVVENTPLATGATVLLSEDLADMPVVTSADRMVVVFDPLGVDGDPETAHVTAHGAGATEATLLRGQENSIARPHANGTPWIHGSTSQDFGAVVRDRRWQRGPEKIFNISESVIRTESTVANSSDDEFDDDTLDPAWVRVDYYPLEVRWVESGSALSMRFYRRGGDPLQPLNAINALLRPVGGLAIGQSIETCVSFCGPSTSTAKFGLMFSDGTTFDTGTEVMTTIDLATSSPERSFGTRSHAGFTSTPAAGTTGLPSSTPARLFLRLRWYAANTFRAEVSQDGISWLDNLVSTRATTLTPTYMGLWFGPFASSGSPHFSLSFDYFRVTPVRGVGEY